MKDNVLYINFSFEHKKRKIKDTLIKLLGIKKHKKSASGQKLVKRAGLYPHRGVL